MRMIQIICNLFTPLLYLNKKMEWNTNSFKENAYESPSQSNIHRYNGGTAFFNSHGTSWQFTAKMLENRILGPKTENYPIFGGIQRTKTTRSVSFPLK